MCVVQSRCMACEDTTEADTATCESSRLRQGCRIQEGACLCGTGCNTDYRYANKIECDAALRGICRSIFSNSLSAKNRSSERTIIRPTTRPSAHAVVSTSLSFHTIPTIVFFVYHIAKISTPSLCFYMIARNLNFPQFLKKIRNFLS